MWCSFIVAGYIYLSSKHCCAAFIICNIAHLPFSGVLRSPWPYQEGNKLGSISGTRAISTI